MSVIKDSYTRSGGFVLRVRGKETHLGEPLFFSAPPVKGAVSIDNPPILTASRFHAYRFSYLKAAYRVASELQAASLIAFFAEPLHTSKTGTISEPETQTPRSAGVTLGDH